MLTVKNRMLTVSMLTVKYLSEEVSKQNGFVPSTRRYIEMCI